MPVFILFSLTIGYLTYNTHPFLAYILSSRIEIFAEIILLISVIGIFVKKPRMIDWDEIFACCAIFIWLNEWEKLFQDESPIFYYFPFYLAFVAGLIYVLSLVTQTELDKETVVLVRSLMDSTWVYSLITIAAVLISIQLTNHYLIFPVSMTLFLIKVAFFESFKKYTNTD